MELHHSSEQEAPKKVTKLFLNMPLAWYRKSADQGDALAQFDIGSMYRHGEGVPKDAAQAAAWYRKAADQGYAFAQSNLGVMYGQGDGVPKDDAQALIWF